MSARSELRDAAMERAEGRCEFPGCSVRRPTLQMAHLKGAGMGGSRYRDNIDNVAMLCAELHHPWLDGGIIPNARRFENEMILRAVLDRPWNERR